MKGQPGMNRRRWLLLSLLLLIPFAVYLEPTRVLWGSLRGEAFYDGRPKSWWANELQQWHPIMCKIHDDGRTTVSTNSQDFNNPQLVANGFVPLLFRRPNWMQNAWHSVFDGQLTQSSNGPALLHGDPDAQPILEELAEHESEEVRLLARHGLAQIAAWQAR
jgi:hypothetical protein